MSDSKIHLRSTEKVRVDETTLAAIDRGLQDANSGRTVSLDDLRKMISSWRTKDTQGKQPWRKSRGTLSYTSAHD